MGFPKRNGGKEGHGGGRKGERNGNFGDKRRHKVHDLKEF